MSAFEDSSGKINLNLFDDILFPFQGKQREEVLVGAQFGVDTSVIDIGNGQGLAVSSDPLSLIPSLGLEESAWLSVHLLANDMATTGFSPQFAQFVLNLPTSLSATDFKVYWEYIHKFCKEIGVAITGGHTGQVPDQNSTISGGGTMFLQAPLNEIITSNHATNGDVIIVTKETALTATSILALTFSETVKNKLGIDIYEQAASNFYKTSVLPEALQAAKILSSNKELKAMHDVTEGGLIGAICEMAQASNCGFKIEDNRIPVEEAQLQVAALFDIDHRYIVGAGSMVMAVKKGAEHKLIEGLKKCHIHATAIGKFTDKTKGYQLIEENKISMLKYNGKDPYWGAFFNALNKGWT